VPRALFLSPHFDDVAFSCGATSNALAAAGCETTLCTVFTRSVPHPTGFALACQLDKGLDAAVDYLALRRHEDDAAAATLAATHSLRLELPEAPHRGYECAAALFGDYAAEDDIAEQLARTLEPLLAASDAVFAPQALGAHVDHRRVRDAVLACSVTRRDPDGGASTYWYRDLPYAINHSAATSCPAIEMLPERAFELRASAMTTKLAACACYGSQLGFQFGDAAAMRRTLDDFARAEAARFLLAQSAEVFRSSAALPSF